MQSEWTLEEIQDLIQSSLKEERKRLAEKIRQFVRHQMENAANHDPAQNCETLARFIESEDNE